MKKRETMLSKELYEKLAERTGLEKKDVINVLKGLRFIVFENALAGRETKVGDFGRFKLIETKGRKYNCCTVGKGFVEPSVRLGFKMSGKTNLDLKKVLDLIDKI